MISRQRRTPDQKKGNEYILLIEDDPDDVRLIGEALSYAGICLPIIHLENGDQAMRYLSPKIRFNNPQSFPLPRLLLLDLKMPKRGGFEVLKWIQSQEHLRNLAVVVLTGSIRDEDRQLAKELGASDYRIKPISFFELVRVIREIKERWIVETAACFESDAGRSGLTSLNLEAG